MKKKLVESSLGVKTTEATARHIDDVLKTLPKTDAYKYRRKSVAAAPTEIQSVERTDVSLVSTLAMDRDQEIVVPDGIELEQYRLNPVVLYSHNQELPVGKCLWIKSDPDGLKAKTFYPPRPSKFEGEWLSDFAFEMVRADVLRGKSIGGLPLEIRDPTPEELAINPELQLVIAKLLLLEYSVVALPANPLALVEVVKGRSLSTLAPLGIKVMGMSKRRPKIEPAPRQMTVADAMKGWRIDPDEIARRAVENVLKRGQV